ncbi:hypothetical protein [Nonomuraea sp. NPDC049480]
MTTPAVVERSHSSGPGDVVELILGKGLVSEEHRRAHEGTPGGDIGDALS